MGAPARIDGVSSGHSEPPERNLQSASRRLLHHFTKPSDYIRVKWASNLAVLAAAFYSLQTWHQQPCSITIFVACSICVVFRTAGPGRGSPPATIYSTIRRSDKLLEGPSSGSRRSSVYRQDMRSTPDS